MKFSEPTGSGAVHHFAPGAEFFCLKQLVLEPVDRRNTKGIARQLPIKKTLRLFTT
jgi:hypothetical protein